MRSERGLAVGPVTAIAATDDALNRITSRADGKLQIRSVATGEQIGAWLIITQGVRAGEKVIVSDLARLAPGMAVCAVSAHEQ
jgi:membrane fusion protein (multidrug efflux system)